MGAADGFNACPRDAKEALRAAAAFRRRIAHLRRDIAFSLQAIERGIYGPDGNFTIGAQFDFLADGDAVGAVFQAQEGQNDDVFEFAEEVAVAH